MLPRSRDKFREVGLERQDIREYPGGSLAANLVGATGWDGHGLLGLEDSMDSTLAGTDGSETYDRGSDGAVIPGSWRDKQPAVNGSGVELTIDSDLQFYVQQQVQIAKDKSGAKNASVVVMDSKTGQVLAMSNDSTFNPAIGIDKNAPTAEMGNPSVSTPFEPGSVNKIVTAAAAIEDGKTTPDEVLQVPGSITMAGATVKDAWDHGVAPYTSTGVFGKSSNVGTLMLAQRVGEDRYADMLNRFGLGQRTDVGLPGESAGSVPSRDQWSGGTFANLPIGQGLSMTTLQMTGMYQAIANDGVRVPPRIVKSTVDSSGTRTETPQPEGVEVVSAQTAATVRDIVPIGHSGRHRQPTRNRCCRGRRGIPGQRKDRYRAAGGSRVQVLLQLQLLDHLRGNRACGQSSIRDRESCSTHRFAAWTAAAVSRRHRCSTTSRRGCSSVTVSRCRPTPVASWCCRRTDCGVSVSTRSSGESRTR